MTSETVKKTSTRGGRRPGAGRRPVEGKKLEEMVVARMTKEQKSLFRKMGGTKWLRDMLNNGLASDTQISEKVPNGIKEQGKFKMLPLFESGVQAGFPSPAEDYEKKDIDLNKVLISNAKTTCVMRVRGESMNAAGIDDHDLILVDRSKVARVGDIVVMRVNNEFTVKRFLKDERGMVYLHPESTTALYSDIYPEELDEWESFGIVTYVIKKLTNR